MSYKNPWNDPNAQEEAQHYDNPIPSRLLILKTIEALQKTGKCTNMTALTDVFEMDEALQLDALSHRLKAMLRDGQLIRDDAYCYQLAPEPVAVTGKVSMNPKGFGFVSQDNADDLYLHERQAYGVFHGDLVRAQVVQFKGKEEARILEVIERAQSTFVGTLYQDPERGQYFVTLGGNNSHQVIALNSEDVDNADARLGDVLKVNITQMPSNQTFAAGTICEVLDDSNDLKLIIQTALYNFDIPHEFSQAALDEAARFKDSIAKRDLKGRTDLRDLPFVTIDGEDSRDFDDAVYAKKRQGGHYTLYVAIADVSHYVKEGSALDKDAYARGTSVYFPHAVIPMLPERLSNGLCSLNPQVDRLCMCAQIDVSKAGRMTKYDFYPAVIHSHARLTYNAVNAYFDNPQSSGDDGFDRPGVQESLGVLRKLYQALDVARQKRGAMSFETHESLIKFDDQGDIEGITQRTRGIAHKLIEECMLLANVAAGRFALAHELPILYRNHDRPDAEKTERLKTYLAGFGLAFPQADPTHADYARIIEATRERPDAVSIHSMLLRSMMQANYSGDNIGHFGLAYEEYAHFTSPIRRYPDLMLHRAIKNHLKGKKTAVNLDEAGVHTSSVERRAEEASRFVEGWLKCHYMKNHIGEVFDASISSVTSFGLFVTLDALFIDGLVHISSLGDDYFVFDEQAASLVGQTSPARYSLGDSVQVKVMGVNMDLQQIDFELLKETPKQDPSPKRRRQRRKKKS